MEGGASVTTAAKVTAADLAGEPADGLVRELHDGEVVVLPPEDEHHAWHVRLADLMLSVGAPDDVEIHQRTGVHLDEGTFYVPDLLVVRRGTPFHDNGFDASGVVLVVEVIAPQTLVADRLTKPWRYAEAGIPYFWRIDEGPRLVALRLDPTLGDGHYIYDTELVPSEDGEVPHPWPVRIDMAEFVTPPSLR
jgi:Uma2 family endonuclease